MNTEKHNWYARMVRKLLIKMKKEGLLHVVPPYAWKKDWNVN